MAQVHSKQVLVETATELWERHGKRYRSLIPEYEKLLAKKRELKITPLNRVNQTTINEIPNIGILMCHNKQELRALTKRYSSNQLADDIFEANAALGGYAFRTVKTRISDFRCEIRNYEYKKEKKAALSG